MRNHIELLRKHFKVLASIIIVGAGLAAFTWFQITNKPYLSPGDPGYATLDAILADGSVTSGTILVSNSQTLDASSNRTLLAGLTLKVLQGGSITIPTGRTFTISGKFEAGTYSVFTYVGTGKAVFSAGSVSKVWANWFGADPSESTNSQPAFQAALESVYNGQSGAPSCNLVGITPGTYRVDSTTTLHPNICFEGDYHANTTVRGSASFPYDRAANGGAIFKFGYLTGVGDPPVTDEMEYLRNIYIDMNVVPKNHPYDAVWLYANSRRYHFRNVRIWNSPNYDNDTTGIHYSKQQFGHDGVLLGTAVAGETATQGGNPVVGNGTSGPYDFTVLNLGSETGKVVVHAGGYTITGTPYYYWDNGAYGGWDTGGTIKIWFPGPIGVDAPITVDYYYNCFENSHINGGGRDLDCSRMFSDLGAVCVEPNNNAQEMKFENIKVLGNKYQFVFGGLNSKITGLGIGATGWSSQNTGGDAPMLYFPGLAPVVNFHGTYADYGYVSVIWLDLHTSYSNNNNYVNFSGYFAGLDGTSSRACFIGTYMGNYPAVRDSDTQFHIPNFTCPGFWAGQYIVIKCASGDTYVYYVTNKETVGSDAVFTVSTTKYLTGGAAPPVLPADIDRMWCVLQNPQWWSSTCFFHNAGHYQNLAGLRLGAGPDDPSYMGPFPGDMLYYSWSGTVDYDVGTISAGTEVSKTIPVSRVRANSGVNHFDAANATEAAKFIDGISIVRKYTTDGNIVVRIRNSSASNWTPGLITWRYLVLKGE